MKTHELNSAKPGIYKHTKSQKVHKCNTSGSKGSMDCRTLCVGPLSMAKREHVQTHLYRC